MGKKTVLAFGTFDLLHPGHVSYLSQAKALGDRLVVIVATDANVSKIKGKAPVNSQEARRELVAALRIVDEAIVGVEDDMIRSVEKVRPDIVALGYDQKPENEKLKKMFEERGIRALIARLAPYKTENYKSSKIREKIVGLREG